MAIMPAAALLSLLLVLSVSVAAAATRSTYLVFHAPPLRAGGVGSHPLFSFLPPHLHYPRPRLLYSYSLATAGFAARLTPPQAAALKAHPSVLAVLPDRARHLHTTHSPAFLRLSLNSGLWPLSNFASDVVVGVLDTGIYPNRPSFADDSQVSPIPSSFRGGCVSTASFNASAFCNRKLVGAKFFYKGYEAAAGTIDESKESKSPLDTEGHGTHTASTAAGAYVADTGFFQYARGDARGMATEARIAAYKICWASGCFDSDILAAMDEAIADGVDVISLSVGATGFAPKFHDDSIAIGAFGAVRHGVVVSCSAGNSGPGDYTATNIAPWILTVGASTIDREFPADVILGDGTVYSGVSLYSGTPLNSSQLPLVYAGDAGSNLCILGAVDSSKVAGKIVLCDRGVNARVEKGASVKMAGGVGMILANMAESGEETLADSHLVPATTVGRKAGDMIRQYVKTEVAPTATIVFKGTVIGSSPSAPRVAAFSSRGPNYRAGEIFKPDVIAPGVNILAAWTGANSPTDLAVDTRRVEFNIISGTSMSCPHVSGIAALLRGTHRDWSPAAVKSALMTTAYNLDNSGEIIKDSATGKESTPFVRGAGHVDPNKALDPGLVYDAQINDYIAFLCALGYTSDQIAVFTRDTTSVNCSAVGLTTAGDLNYPAFSVVFSSTSSGITYHRTVRNVGSDANTTYKVSVAAPSGVDVAVTPSTLAFNATDQSLDYKVTFVSAAKPVGSNDKYSFGSITWTDGSYVVASPIAVTWPAASIASM